MKKFWEDTLYAAIWGLLSVAFILGWAQTGHCAGSHVMNRAYAEAAGRNVFVGTNHSQASGVLMQCFKNVAIAITNFHALEVGSPITILKRSDGNNYFKTSARVTAASPEMDLVVLEFELPCEVPVLEPAFGDVQPLDAVLSVGNPAGLPDIVSTGIVGGISPDGNIISTVVAVGGFSGSGLWNERGQLVGINSRAVSSHNATGYLAVAIHGKIVKEFWRKR